MYFAVDADTGDQVTGWVTPDNPSVVPEIVVHFNGTPVSEVQASVIRPDLRDPGLHSTGQCGYVVNEENAPGLASQTSLEFYHKEDGILVFRRPPPGWLANEKLFRLETQFVWHQPLNAMLRDRFQMPYSRLEQLGTETLGWITRLPFSNSIYATGRINIRPLEAVLRDRGFLLSVLLRDPVEELAEQLLLFRLASTRTELISRFRLSEARRSVVARMAAQSWETTDELESILSTLDDQGRAALSNPLIKLLAANSMKEEAEPDMLRKALNVLAGFHAVGLRSDLAGFLDTLSALLNVETLPEVEQPEFGSVSELAQTLRDRPSVRSLVGLDVELYATVEAAYAAASLENG